MQISKVKRRRNPRDYQQNDFYHSSEWRKKRKQILVRDNYQCQPCKRQGIIKPGNIVDHIDPIESGGSKLADINLETSCKTCHASKSATERRNISKVGGGSSV